MEKCSKITIAKNRGWRGLTEVKLLNEDNKEIASQVFSFSQPMWDDLIKNNVVVVQDDDNYFVIHFEPSDKLPKADQQRSVLIRNVTLTVTEVNKYAMKSDWSRGAISADYNAIYHYTKNNNNHTTSNWNYIGLRVIPEI